MKTSRLFNALMHRFHGPETGGESGSTGGGTPAGTPSPTDGQSGDTGRGADLRDMSGSSGTPDAGGDDSPDGHDGGNDSGDDAVGEDGKPAPRRQRTEAERMQRRMDRRTRLLGEKDQRIAQLEAQLNGRQPQPRQRATEDGEGVDDDTTPVQTDEREIERRILTRAEQIAEDRIKRNTISDQTEKMIKTGKALDPKFDDAAREVSMAIPFVTGPQGRESASPFIEALYECDHPAAILLHLHANPDELDDLADMPLKKQERALLKLDIQLATAGATRKSGAPKPLEVITGGRSNTTSEARMTDEEWRSQRLKQRSKT